MGLGLFGIRLKVTKTKIANTYIKEHMEDED